MYAIRSYYETDLEAVRAVLFGTVQKLHAFVVSFTSTGAVDTAEEETEIEKVKHELARVLKEVEHKATEETLLTGKYNDLKHSIEAESQESREAEREVFRIVGEQRETENGLARIDAELQVLSRDREEFKRELQEAVS